MTVPWRSWLISPMAGGQCIGDCSTGGPYTGTIITLSHCHNVTLSHCHTVMVTSPHLSAVSKVLQPAVKPAAQLTVFMIIRACLAGSLIDWPSGLSTCWTKLTIKFSILSRCWEMRECLLSSLQTMQPERPWKYFWVVNLMFSLRECHHCQPATTIFHGYFGRKLL